MSTITKPKLRFWQILNMSIGFFGIQFGWDLQRANMGRIYENLGAKPEEIPILFLAAPLSGLLIQPIVGYLSDKTWSPTFGRRRPYFFIGALFASIGLLFMPDCSELWMAAGLLWVLDVFGNVSMEPFRAFVTDKLPDSQVNKGFVMQSFMIGLGGSIASALPWIMNNVFHVTNTAAKGTIPENVKYSFYIGAFFFFFSVLYTVLTSKEYPPTEEDLKENNKKENGFSVFISALKNMPKQMKIISLVQFFTWPGLFLMWFYYSTAVAVNVFGGKNDADPLYAQGAEFAGLTLSFYNVITFLFALILPKIADRIGRRLTHTICLLFGAVGLISVAFISNKYMLYVSMTGVGIAWASILSMPYAIISKYLPANKVGIYMGIFNFFIVLPEIIISFGFGWVMEHVLHNDRLVAVQLGGFLMIIAAAICFFMVKESHRTPSENI